MGMPGSAHTHTNKHHNKQAENRENVPEVKPVSTLRADISSFLLFFFFFFFFCVLCLFRAIKSTLHYASTFISIFVWPRLRASTPQRCVTDCRLLDQRTGAVNAPRTGHHVGLISIVVSTPHCACGNPSSILGLDTMSEERCLCISVHRRRPRRMHAYHS